MASQARILVLEHDACLRELVEIALNSAGYSVSAAITPLDALDLLDSLDEPDVIVLDLVMPAMDGETFCRQARALGYSGPVLVLFGSPNAKEAAARLGVQLVPKPFEPGSLCGAVDWSLRQIGDAA